MGNTHKSRDLANPAKKRALFRVTPPKNLGMVGTFFVIFFKDVIIFKSILIYPQDYFSHFKDMQFIDVCRATIFCDYWTFFFCLTGTFLARLYKVQVELLYSLWRPR